MSEYLDLLLPIRLSAFSLEKSSLSSRKGSTHIKRVETLLAGIGFADADYGRLANQDITSR